MTEVIELNYVMCKIIAQYICLLMSNFKIHLLQNLPVKPRPNQTIFPPHQLRNCFLSSDTLVTPLIGRPPDPENHPDGQS